MNKRNSVIDIVKYISACTVVFLHVINICNFTGIQNSIKIIMYEVVRFLPPVEFFFITAGYLFFIKKPNKEKLYKYIKRLIVLYLLYMLFYIDVMVQHFPGRPIWYNILSFINQVFFVGYSSFSWYMVSLIYGIIIVYILNKYIKNKKIINGIICIIIIINLLRTTYFYTMPSVLQFIFSKMPIGILRGTIYIYLGFLIANKKVENESLIKNLFLWIIFFCCSIVEKKVLSMFNIGDIFNTLVSVIFMTYYLLKTLLILNSKIKIKDNMKSVFTFLGKASTVIYFLHMFCKDRLSVYNLNPYIEFVTIIVILTIFTYIIDKLSEKKRLKFLKLLY